MTKVYENETQTCYYITSDEKIIIDAIFYKYYYMMNNPGKTIMQNIVEELSKANIYEEDRFHHYIKYIDKLVDMEDGVIFAVE
jgi:predicted helicase